MLDEQPSDDRPILPPSATRLDGDNADRLAETEIDAYPTVVRPAPADADPFATVFPAEAVPGEASRDVRYVGNFELLEEIARGAMGVVYKARQANLNRIVALKMILSGQLAGADDVDRFRMEAAAAASLDHPGIVPIFEIGEHDGRHYFAMGFIDGPSLASLVANGPLAPRDAARYASQIADAVQYAHDRGVIHRDLKPANILIDHDDRPKVTDFGLAKRLEGDSALTATGQVMGTPSYMPPEQASGDTRGIGPSADVYSLGATLYCLLTGRPPFLAAGIMETLTQVLEKDPLSPRKLNPEIAVDLETICLKCLEKDPSRRYASARQVGEELDRFLNDEPILARPIIPVARAWRWCGRNRSVASAATLAASLVLLVAIAGPIVAIRQATLREKEAAARLTAETARNAESTARQSAETARNAETIARKSAERATADLASEKDRAVARNYASSVSLAHLETLNNNVNTARQILGDCPDTARGWEWNYVDALANPERLILRGHAGQVVTVRFSPDSRRLISLGGDGKVVIWDVAEGQQLRQLGPVGYQTLSPDGRLLADWEGEEIVIRDASTGATLTRFASGNTRPLGRAFSPDGRYLAAAYAGMVVRVDLANHNAVTTLRGKMEGRKVELAMSFDGSRLAAGLENGTILVWDVIAAGEPRRLQGHLLSVDGVVFSPDGKTLASTSFDGTVRLWDFKAARELRALRGHVGWVYKAAFSPDGRYVASAGWDNSVRLWDVASGREMFQFRGNNAYVFNVAFSPDGKAIASSCADGSVRVWDVRQALASAESIPEEMVRSAGAAAGPGAREELHQSLMRYRTPDQTLGVGHESMVESVRFAPDGKSAATSGRDGTVRLWDPETGKSIRVIRVDKDNFASRVAFSFDGRALAVSTSKGIDETEPGKAALSAGQVKVYDPATGKERMTIGVPAGPVLALAAHPRRNLLAVAAGYPAVTLATAGIQGIQPIPTEVRIWDLDGRSATTTIPYGMAAVRSLAFHSDGSRIITAGVDGVVKVRDVDDGRERLSIEAGAFNAVSSPDGCQIATAGADGSIKLWDSASGQLLRPLEGHSKFVLGLAYSPDGSRLASSSHDTTVKIWDPAAGLELLTLRGHSHEVYDVAFDPAGRRLASAGYDGTVMFWDSRMTPEDRSVDSWPLVVADDFRRDAPGDRWKTIHGEWKIKEGRLEGRIQPQTIAGLPMPVVSSRVTLQGVRLPTTCEVRFDLRVPKPIVCQILFLNEAQSLGETIDLAGVINPFFKVKVSVLMAQLRAILFAPITTNRAFQLEPGSTHDVRILRQPNQLTVKVDGHIVLNGRQHAIEGAMLSLAGIHGQSGDTIEFANLRIHAPQSAIDEQSARATVDRLFAEVGLRSEVIDRLHSDQQTSKSVVERALRIAKDRDEDPEKLGDDSIVISLVPDRDPSAYALAFRQAEAADRMNPDSSNHLFELGAACYRVGDDRKALEVLIRARERKMAEDGYVPPYGVAFVAMARFRLGDRDGAKREFERFRDLMRFRAWKDDENAKRLFREAEARLGTLAAPDAESEAIKDVVFNAEQKGWTDGDLAAYMAARTEDYSGTSLRGPEPGPADVTASGPSIAAIRRLQFREISKDVYAHYNDVRCEVSGDRASLSYEVTVINGNWLRSWVAHFDLRRTPAGWKIFADRGWPIRAREGGKIIPLASAYWAERDRRVEQARASDDRRAVVDALVDASRPVEALAASRKLTESPGATAADWVLRGTVALSAFDAVDAVESMKKALAIDSKATVPAWGR
jgi:eukaryotic-like serine/threonine-protein kinase